MSAKKKTPIWLWFGCGCVTLVLLGVVLLGGAGFLGFSQLKSMVEDMADPLARDEATMRLLGAEALPEGWHSHVFFQIPFLMKIAILTDGPVGESIEGSFEEKAEALENFRLRSDDLGRNVFIYFEVRGRGDEPIEDLIAGRSSGGGATKTQVDLDLEIEPDVELDAGTFEAGSQQIEWRAQTGTMQVVGGELQGIYAALRLTCPDGTLKDALWFQGHEVAEEYPEGDPSGGVSTSLEAAAGALDPSADEVVPYEDRDLTGTPADVEALRGLFGHFNVCP
ncbi:MAG: hypothetical protein AAGM22_02400 [Acidobacteriota bacterium]